MRIGAHVSIAGGYATAVKRVADMGGNCLQMFSSSPRGWNMPEISDDDAAAFRAARKTYDVNPIYFHASYLINLADTGSTGHLSKTSLITELALAHRIGVRGSVVHVGSFKDRSDTPAYEHPRYPKFLDQMKEVLDAIPSDVELIIEHMGMRKIGKSIAEVGRIIEDLDDARLRVCLDTCHLHAAGYELRTDEGLEQLIQEIDSHIGMDRLSVWHVNDSKDELGSFRDRHDNIGEGSLGLDAFRRLLNHPRMKGLPFIMEVPGFDGKGPDARNMTILKDLVS